MIFQKKLVPVLLGLSLFSVASFGANYGMAGCGLGALVLKDKPGPVQIGAAFLNYIGYQTFAISSGTSNCKDSGGDEMAYYINVNQVALKKDISKGSGETLAGLYKIMKCGNESKLSQKLQENYNKIFSGSELEDGSLILKNIKSTILQDSQLSGSCEVLG